MQLCREARDNSQKAVLGYLQKQGIKVEGSQSYIKYNLLLKEQMNCYLKRHPLKSAKAAPAEFVGGQIIVEFDAGTHFTALRAASGLLTVQDHQAKATLKFPGVRRVCAKGKRLCFLDERGRVFELESGQTQPQRVLEGVEGVAFFSCSYSYIIVQGEHSPLFKPHCLVVANRGTGQVNHVQAHGPLTQAAVLNSTLLALAGEYVLEADLSECAPTHAPPLQPCKWLLHKRVAVLAADFGSALAVHR
jgi:hypothetical protein